MKLSVLKEVAAGDRRVAATPETVKKYVGLGHEVTIEAGAGVDAGYTDEAYKEAGAKVEKTAASAVKAMAGLYWRMVGYSSTKLAEATSKVAITLVTAARTTRQNRRPAQSQA